MSRPVWTYALAMAAGTDAANRRMRRAGRETWNRADYNEAVRTFERLCPLAKQLRTTARRLAREGRAS